MKLLIITIMFIGTTFCGKPTDGSLVGLRKQLDECRKNRTEISTLSELIETTLFTNKALKLGYLSMKEMLLCEESKNPAMKLNHFKTGKNLLEKSITLDPGNAELHFFRYATQQEVPALLGYNENRKEDKEFLFNYIEQEHKNTNKDIDLYSRIKTYLYLDKNTSKEEQNILKQL